MLRYTLTLIGFLSFICAVKAQLPLPTIQWSNIYGGNQNNDVCYAAEQTSNGGFILGGYTARNYIGGEDLCLIKIDSLGNQEWLHTYGGAGPDLGKCMTLAADGGYLIAGYTYSFGAGLADMYLVKTDAQGNQQWQRTYGGPGYDYCESIEPTSDGGYILGGNSTSFPGSGWGAMYLVKIDSVGTIQWQHTYNGQNGSGCASVKQTLDGGYIAGGGYIYSQSSSDLWLVKTNGLGIVEWDQKYGGSSHDGCFDVELTDNGGYIAGGASDSFGSGYQIYVVKTDSLGTMQWQRNYGGYYGDYCYSVLKTPDSGFLLGGVNSGNYWLIKIDSTGNQMWDQTFNYGQNDVCHSICQAADGSLLLAGTVETSPTDLSMWAVRLSGLQQAWVSVTPQGAPIVIPPGGGSFPFSLGLTNCGTIPCAVNVWVMVRLPNGSLYGPVLGPANLRLPTGATLSRLRTQNVPANAPAGTYTYQAFVGDYPAVKWDSSSFTFEKQGAGSWVVGGGLKGWENEGEDFDGGARSVVSLSGSGATPTMVVSPNPFNPTTTFTFTLPEAAKVTLEVFDIKGQRVWAQHAAPLQAGEQSIVFDGSSLPSGVYLYRLNAGELTASGKIVLMK